MVIATINRFILLFRGAFDALNAQVSLAECERLGVMVHRSMDPNTRSYHTPGHVFAMCEGMNPQQTLAALFHDVVYYQLDNGYPASVAHLLEDVVQDEQGNLVLKPIAPQDTALRMCADVFGFAPGATLGLYAGLNEFLSAVVAARLLTPYLAPHDVLAVVACIEATIPFRGPDANGVTEAQRLSQRLAHAAKTHLGGMAESPRAMWVDSAVKNAVTVSNRDVSGFGQSDPGHFLSSTWLLIEESNAPLKSAGIYTLSQYRAALMRMEGFLRSLKPQDIFQTYGGTPSSESWAGMTSNAKSNIEFACDFLDAKIVAVAIVEALALHTGGDCPVSMFLGDISSPYGKPDRVEDFLPPVTQSKAHNAALLAVFEQGRSMESSNDLTASPLTAYIYRQIGHEATHQALQRARAMFSRHIGGLAFLKTLEPTVVKSIIGACAHIAMSRKDALLELQESL